MSNFAKINRLSIIGGCPNSMTKRETKRKGGCIRLKANCRPLKNGEQPVTLLHDFQKIWVQTLEQTQKMGYSGASPMLQAFESDTNMGIHSLKGSETTFRDKEQHPTRRNVDCKQNPQRTTPKFHRFFQLSLVSVTPPTILILFEGDSNTTQSLNVSLPVNLLFPNHDKSNV